MSEPHDELVMLWTASGTEAESRAWLEHVRSCAACQSAAPKLGVAIDALEGGTVGRTPEAAPAGGLAPIIGQQPSNPLYGEHKE